MIKLITGKRGTGKTKILIDAIHEAENKSNGNVVAIQKGSSLNTDITPKVRLINIEDYAVEGVDAFYGFVSGILASDYDWRRAETLRASLMILVNNSVLDGQFGCKSDYFDKTRNIFCKMSENP